MSEENKKSKTQDMDDGASQEEATEDVSKETIDRLIRNHVYGSMTAGLIPLPMVDLIAVTGIQLNMVRKMAKLYRIPFSRERTKNIIFALVGGTVPAVTSFPVASAVKAIPLIGFSLGAVSMPVISGASTYAVGKVFYRHFASGGTFLTFDAEKAKASYADMLQQGTKVSQSLQPQPA